MDEWLAPPYKVQSGPAAPAITGTSPCPWNYIKVELGQVPGRMVESDVFNSAGWERWERVSFCSNLAYANRPIGQGRQPALPFKDRNTIFSRMSCDISRVSRRFKSCGFHIKDRRASETTLESE